MHPKGIIFLSQASERYYIFISSIHSFIQRCAYLKKEEKIHSLDNFTTTQYQSTNSEQDNIHIKNFKFFIPLKSFQPFLHLFVLTTACKLFLIDKAQLFAVVQCTEEKETIEFSVSFFEKILR